MKNTIVSEGQNQPLRPFTRRVKTPKTRQEAKGSQEKRLMVSMARCVGRLGYSHTSVADVIAEAGVSRKTFYEYFRDKEECFLAAYRRICEQLIAALGLLAKDRKGGAREPLVEAQMRDYLQVLGLDLLAARAFVIEVAEAGPRARAVRDELNGEFADLVFGYVTDDPQIRRAIIGGVHDLVGHALSSGETDVRKLLPVLKRFVLGDW